MNIDKIITTVLVSALVAWQPDCSDDAAKTPRKVHNKPIHAIVVDVTTVQVNHFRDLHDKLVHDHPLIIDRILIELESRNQMYHESAARMICTEDGRAELAKQKRHQWVTRDASGNDGRRGGHRSRHRSRA